MKEATGELQSTVIVVISVGILSAFFFGTLWPIMKGNLSKNTDCDKATCDCSERNSEGKCKCEIRDDDGNVVVPELWCIYKG